MIRLQQKDSLRAHFHIFISSYLHIGISGSLEFLVLLGQAKRTMMAKQAILPTKNSEEPQSIHSHLRLFGAINKQANSPFFKL